MEVKIDGIVPEVAEDYQHFSLIRARHSLIEPHDVVANDIVLNAPKRMLLISGSKYRREKQLF